MLKSFSLFLEAKKNDAELLTTRQQCNISGKPTEYGNPLKDE